MQEAASVNEMVHTEVLNKVNQEIKELADKYGTLIVASVRKGNEGCAIVYGNGSKQNVVECAIFMKEAMSNLINTTENSEEA